MADCVQFLSKNGLNGCQSFGRFSFKKLNPNGILVLCTSLIKALTSGPTALASKAQVLTLALRVVALVWVVALPVRFWP